MLKLLYLAEFVDINIKYIASNTSLMMSLSVGYPQILVSGYPDSKFTIRFSPNKSVAAFAVLELPPLFYQVFFSHSQLRGFMQEYVKNVT